jgi:hypothetical protein
MRLPESDQESALSVSPDVPTDILPGQSSSLSSDVSAGPSKAHANGNGFTGHVTNGSSPSLGMGMVLGNGVLKHGKSVKKVSLPGTTLYGDSVVDREEFVRLVVQSLRDVGYMYVLPPLLLVAF